MKKTIASLAIVAMVGIARAIDTTNYVPDGQFESPNGDVGPWSNMFGGDAISFLSTGGNPDGCLQITDAGSYGGVAYVNPPDASTQPTLASLGLVAGQTYTFVMDMQIVSGSSIGGLKIESWTDTASIGNSGDLRPLSGTANWATYTFTYKIAAGSTHLNIVPLWGANSTVNYDNIGVIIPGPAPATVSITSPTNSQVVYSNFTINATASVNPGTVTNVSFYVDNVLGGKATNSPFAYIAIGVGAGAHTLKAVALDSNGNAATSSVVNITVTNAAIPSFAAYESFNYSGALANGTASTGTGFAGNWSCGADGTIVSGLTYPNLASADNALQSASWYQLESLATVPSGIATVWVSFIFNQAGDNGGNRDGFVMEDGTGKGVMFAYHQNQAAIGNPALTKVSSYSAVGTELTPFSGQAQTYNANNFYVFQLNYTGGSLSSIAVYSNPSAGPGHTTPPTPDFTVSSGLSGIGALSVLGVVHQAGMSLTVDEVRVGATYASVVGANLNPTVATTLTLTNAPAKRISWTASNTNYYQPQKSTDNSNWSNLGNLLTGSAVTTVNDPAPVAFYQILEIGPVASEQTVDGGFEVDGGDGSAFYWNGVGSQRPARITSDFHSGTACMSLFVTNDTITANTSELQQKLSFVGGGTITGGNNYTLSFWAKSLGRYASGGYVQQYQLVWLNAGGGIVGSVGFAAFAGGNGTWSQISTGPVVAPASAVNAQINIHIGTGGILNDFGGVLVDDVSLAAFSPGDVINVLSPTIQNTAVLAATILVNGSPATDATGTVEFKTNSVVLNQNVVAGGIAASAPAVFPATYTATATYFGDAVYIGSTATLVVGGGGMSTTPTNITASVSGNQLTLSWPADHLGWILQSQTNNLNAGLKANWVDVPGSQASTQAVITIIRANPSVFYRLRLP